VDHLDVLRLHWPENPKVVREGDPLSLSLVLENTGVDRVEFKEAFLVVFGRIFDENGRAVETSGFRLARKLPAISYRLDPGDTEIVGVGVTLSPEDQRALPVGRYTVVIPLGDARDERTNSVLVSAGADPPPPLTVEIQPSRPR